jgi:signal transduction histidine kinase
MLSSNYDGAMEAASASARDTRAVANRRAAPRIRRAVDRHGARVLLRYFGGLWLAMALLGVLTIANQTHRRDLTVAEVLQFSSLLVLSWAAAATAGLAGTWRLLSPLRELAAARSASDVDDRTWRAAGRIPLTTTAWNCFVIICWSSFPLLSLSTVRPHYVTAEMIGAIDSQVVQGCVLFGVPLVIGAQRRVRLLMGDAVERLTGAQPPPVGPTIGFKLVTAVPFAAVAVMLWAVQFGDVIGGRTEGAAFRDEAAGVLLALALLVPITRMLANSIMRPLDDLMAAAERIKQADFSEQIPESSMDELGAIERAFNDAMAGLAERQALAREREQLLEDVRASRQRIIVASDEARRKLERNIHDGAQQYLVALALDLRLLEDRARESGSAELADEIRAAAAKLSSALDELRELARGVHPAVLETDGLQPALEQLAARATVPVSVSASQARLPPATEAAAYFVAAEALANVAKHARATQARVDVSLPDNGRLLMRISDDGVGGATAHTGSGLAGLEDRVAALGGTLAVASPPGAGTVVSVQLPLPAMVDDAEQPLA